MNKISLLFIAVLMFGCERTYYVQCEKPYYKGHARSAYVDDYGTRIYLTSGQVLRYPPSVRCEISEKPKYNDQSGALK